MKLSRIPVALSSLCLAAMQASTGAAAAEKDTLPRKVGDWTLAISDDGIGRAPEAWSHGLGLGGVRKRVKLLGGRVVWAEQPERGIRCEVQAPLSGEPG